MQASAFVGSHDDLAARRAFGLRDRGQHRFSGFKNFLSIFLEQLASGGNRDPATGTIEEFGADFLLQSAYLGRYRRLRAKALLRGSGEGAMARDLDKGFQLLKVHGENSAFSTHYSEISDRHSEVVSRSLSLRGLQRARESKAEGWLLNALLPHAAA